MPQPLTIWTIGHSTRSVDEFIAVLKEHGIALLADVRLHPGSRRLPHFNKDALAASLAGAGIAYEHMPDLGGRRKPRPDSPNTAWRNESFRGYADYLATPPWLAARDHLARRARETPTAMMCAEMLWWQCHRALIADVFKADGWTVLHITTLGKPAEEHPYTSAATVTDGRLSYAAQPPAPGLFGRP